MKYVGEGVFDCLQSKGHGKNGMHKISEEKGDCPTAMKTLAQKSIAAVRKANKQWKISLCSGAMMELVRCMEMHNSNVSACRNAIEAMSQCMAGKRVGSTRVVIIQ